MVRVREMMRSERDVRSSFAQPAPPRPADRGPREAPPRDGPHIVLLCENRTTRELLLELAEELGCKCQVADTAADAANMIREQRPDAVVADVEADAREPVLLRRALASNDTFDDLPFVALAPRDQFRRIFGSDPRDCDTVVDKPLAPGALRAALVEALGGRSRTPPQPPLAAPPSPPPGHARPTDAAAETPPPGPAASAACSPHDAAKAYDDAAAAQAAILSHLDSGDSKLMREAQRASAVLADCVLQSDRVLMKAMDRSQPFSLAHHSVNVCVFSIKIGQGLDYSDPDLKRQAFVALVHDLGMCRMPQSLLLKEGTLSPEEAEQIKQHPDFTYEIIKSFGQEFEWAAEIARQEHERENGTGYPLGLRGDDIHEMAKVIGVADIFEAFTHPRTFRKTFISNEALQKVIEMRGKFCSSRIIKALMNQVTMFPLGSYVELNTGEIGRVEETTENLLSPTVRVLYDSHGRRLPEQRIVNLDTTYSIFVTRPVAEEDLPSGERHA